MLDEPTVGLDSNNDALVTEAIWRIARGRTTILVTHDLALAARADRVVYLAEGLVAEIGSHAELVRAGGLYADVWRQQQVCADARAA
jgi:ATP-binding cassette subfamily B protein